MFGATNSTCSDSSRVHCDRNAAVGKIPFQARRTRNTWIMKKSAVIHQKAHMGPRWRGTWPSSAGIQPSCLRRGGTVQEGACGPSAGPRPHLLQGPLNWSLRRYVRPSTLSVWLRRRASETGHATAPRGRCGRSRAFERPAGTAGHIRLRPPRERSGGVSLTRRRALRYRASGNRQMEHSVKAVVSLRGGVRRRSAITVRERAYAGTAVLTTLGNKTSV